MNGGDVKLFQTNDGGEVTVEQGIMEMTGGLETAAYLSLFGGDEQGRDWWGNKLETEPARKETSETQELLRSIPLTTGNLLRLQDAAVRDLQWMLDASAATSVEVAVSMPSLNHVDFTIQINGDETLEFSENVKSSREALFELPRALP